MSNRPAQRPTANAPGGLRARADGQKVEVRTYEGELIRIVDSSRGAELIRAGLADNLDHCIRLKLGIRWLPTRSERPSGPPDLDQMRLREPQRYAGLWRGTPDARTGKGALGRQNVDRTVPFKPL